MLLNTNANDQPLLNAQRQEIISDLFTRPATISPKYFYNELGSKLFELICQLPEYYLTRTEQAIFTRHAIDIAQTLGQGSTLIDLGAGNCAKAAQLFTTLQPSEYVPIDISADFLHGAVADLRQRFPDIKMSPYGLDFSTNHWSLPTEINATKRLFFYPGSSIGNFSPPHARQFLSHLRSQCDQQGGILIGVDLVKNITTLQAAYDDNLGVTGAFNVNILNHVNTLLDANFDLRQWRHIAFFNAELSRIEMHLEAQTEIEVNWQNQSRHFFKGERIHTENSYKYTLENFLQLLTNVGFLPVKHWVDDNQWFAVIYAKAN